MKSIWCLTSEPKLEVVLAGWHWLCDNHVVVVHKTLPGEKKECLACYQATTVKSCLLHDPE